MHHRDSDSRIGRNPLQGHITKTWDGMRGQKVKEEGPKMEKECALRRREAMEQVRSRFIQ